MLGIFDSGFGGLTVARAVRAALPGHDILYLGDSARAPYGQKGRAIVTQYTKEGCAYLFTQGCRLIILACNTASAETLRVLQQEWLPILRAQYPYPINIIGVIRPLVEEAVLHTKNRCIGVVGTRSTVQSGAYIAELQAQMPGVRVIQQACPLLVPLVEEGWTGKPETKKILRTYLLPLKTQNPDVLILGCTHYETLHHLFVRKMGTRCNVLHSPTIVAAKLSAYLARHPEYDDPTVRSGVFRCCTTGDSELFAALGRGFYGTDLGEVRKVDTTSS